MGRHIDGLLDHQEERMLMTVAGFDRLHPVAMPRPVRGMTLVELMIGLAVLAFLLMSGAPAFADWIRNLQIRGAGESVLSGIQYARTEAVRRNNTARFQLTDSLTAQCALSTKGLSWVVTLEKDNSPKGKCGTDPNDAADPKILQKQTASTNATMVAISMSRATPSMAFNSLGQQIAVDGVQPAVLTTIDIDSPQARCIKDGGPVRCLRIEVSRGGQIRMCDPGLADTPANRSMACLTR